MASVANLLNPERIVLGGGVATALGEPYLRLVGEAFEQWAFKAVFKTTRLVPALLGDDAGILGAALLARRRFVQSKFAEPVKVGQRKPAPVKSGQ